MTKLYSTNRSFFKEFLEFLLEVNYGHRITQTVTLFSNNHDLFYQLFLICLDWTLSHIKYEKIRMNKKLIFVFCTWLGIHTLLLNENIWFFSPGNWRTDGVLKVFHHHHWFYLVSCQKLISLNGFRFQLMRNS